MRFRLLRKVYLIALILIAWPVLWLYIENQSLEVLLETSVRKIDLTFKQLVGDTDYEDPGVHNLNMSDVLIDPSINKGKQIDDYCESYGDWYSLSNKVYFKKSTCYYFEDLNMITLHYLKDSKYKTNFKFFIQGRLFYKNDLVSFNLEHHGFNYYGVSKYLTDYIHFTMKIDINLHKLVRKVLEVKSKETPNYKIISMGLQIIDTTNNASLKSPLKIKIKNSHLNAKDSKLREVMICSSMIDMTRENEFYSFKKWVEINLLMGYNKIVFFNVPKANLSKDRLEYLDENVGIIDMKQMKCIPNLRKSDHQYNYYRFHDKESDLSLNELNMIVYNDCYLDNMNKFKYIQVTKTDELIYPYAASEVQFHSHYFKKNFLSKAYTINFVNDIKLEASQTLFVNALAALENDTFHNETTQSVHWFVDNYNSLFANRSSVYFYQKFYLNNVYMDQLCIKLDLLMKNMSSINFKKVMLVEIQDELDNYGSMKIRIANRDELLYGVFLCELFEKFTQPLLENTEEGLLDFDINVDRFFSITSSSIRSVHDTDKIFVIQNQYAMQSYAFNERDQVTRYTFFDINKVKRVPNFDYGQFGQFLANPMLFLRGFTFSLNQISLNLSHYYYLKQLIDF